MHVFVRDVKIHRDGMLRLGKLQAKSRAGYASGCNQLGWTRFVNHKGAGMKGSRPEKEPQITTKGRARIELVQKMRGPWQESSFRNSGLCELS
jgi:hypothetical protein